MDELKPLTDRRCEECDLYMFIEDRTAGGGLTLYKCALGHVLLSSVNGQTWAGAQEKSRS